MPASREDQAELDRSLAGAIPKEAVRPLDEWWRLWERTPGCGKHVPDRVGDPTGDVDLGDLGPALLAERALVALVALGVGGAMASALGEMTGWPMRSSDVVAGH
jgi:hypothetical protein